MQETCVDGAMRYVLEGAGTVVCGEARIAVEPNTLVRVRGDEVALYWQPDDSRCSEMILLTPEYRGPPLLPIVAGFGLACVALVVAASGGG